jgi:Domain of unknown function (DUF1707)
MAGPGDEMAAGAAGRTPVRASHADREQVIESLKVAFVHGRLTKDELDARAGRALAARTCAELNAVTVDIPPARAMSGPTRPVPARRWPLARVAAGSGGCLALAAAAVWASLILDPGGPGVDRPLGWPDAPARPMRRNRLQVIARFPFSVGFSGRGGCFEAVFVSRCRRCNRDGFSLSGGKPTGSAEGADLGQLDDRRSRPDHAIAVDSHQQRRGSRAVCLRGGLRQDAAALQPGSAESVRDLQVTLRAGSQ